MKKCMTMIIIIAMVVSIIPSFSYGEMQDPTKVYDNTKYQSAEDIQKELSGQDVSDIQNEGSVEIKGEQTYIRGSENSSVATAGLLTKVLTFLPWVVSCTLSSLVTSGNDMPGEYSTSPEGPFTIENLVFDRYEVLNANYFVYNSSKVNSVVKLNVQNWYTGTMVISIGAALVTLIYMGIKMGISTIASQKAKYKKMLLDWFIGFIMIFVLHIIIIFLSTLSMQITYIFSEAAEPSVLESNVMHYSMEGIQNGKNWGVLSETIIYTVLVFYQLRFFMIYIKRFFMIGFLIVIAPLITITYAIDKASDNKSQIFNAWFKEIAVNIFIQPLHALLYLVFMFSAGQIAMQAPILAVAFLMALSRGEKIVKSIFNLRGLKSIHSMGDTLQLKG